MTHEKYEELHEWMESLYYWVYNKGEHIEELGNLSDYVELLNLVKNEHDRVKLWANRYNAEDKVLKEIDHDFNYLMNELDNVIKEN